MKTMFISLLRMGDLLMHLEVVKAYSKQYPEDEIYILANEEFSEVARLVPERISFLFFPRQELQKQIVDRSYHFRFAYEHVSDLISNWNQIRFDQVINLTHNRPSAYIAGMIHASVKQGLRFESVFIGHEDNVWWSYLNHQFASQTTSQYSYKDILKSALSIRDKKRILIHPFSNDVKKNWSLVNFLEVARVLSRRDDVGSVEFIGTNKDFQKHPQVADEFPICAVSFLQLREELMWCDGLLAVDSSVKHLALSLGCPLVEVAVGSASPSKYAGSEQSTLAAKTSCFPCSYSKPCPHSMPICHEDISINDLITKSITIFGLKQAMENPNGKHAELSA